ncbi:MAG: C40 family peptidase [Microcystis aeruginosa G11-06]|nr:C40 family peptidase [Microcystis aeruginosa G11-06]
MKIISLTPSFTQEYLCIKDLNLYNSPSCQELATQAQQGRQLKFISLEITEKGLQIHQKIPLTRSDIEKHIPEIITFTQEARNRTNHYLWGGTLAPNYDCSGLIQAAFATFGIWLPRDSYQQEAFCQKINREELLPGDLIFFGDKRVNHVALYLGNNQYIHSSGKETGNNGIAINLLTDDRDSVSRHYYQKLWSFGRVMHN